MKPYLTDEEVADITAPLTQGAARIKYFQRLGVKVQPKPNGQPLVWRAEYEARKPLIGGRLTAATICQSAKPFAGIAGVYFLIKDGAIIYVGQSDNVYQRVSKHRATVAFNAWYFVDSADKRQRLDLERAYIDDLAPPLNRTPSKVG